MTAASDLEGTLTTGAQVLGIARYCLGHGRIPALVRFFGVRVPGLILVRLKRIDKQEHGDKLLTDLPQLFKGMSELEVYDAAAWIVAHELWPKRRQNVLAEFEQRRTEGHQLVVTSGAFQPIVEAFAQRIDATGIGTPLEMQNGRSTGRISGLINKGPTKIEQLRSVLKGQELAYAYADGISDLLLLEFSQNPIVVHPDDKLKKVAESRRWRIISD
jgi:HAD superfamily phosphoserine phosphatase-like hydrolase